MSSTFDYCSGSGLAWYSHPQIPHYLINIRLLQWVWGSLPQPSHYIIQHLITAVGLDLSPQGLFMRNYFIISNQTAAVSNLNFLSVIQWRDEGQLVFETTAVRLESVVSGRPYKLQLHSGVGSNQGLSPLTLCLPSISPFHHYLYLSKKERQSAKMNI